MLRRSTLAVLLLVALGAWSNNNSTQGKPSRYLYVWAGTGHDSTKGLDIVTVIDANPASRTYGAVLSALTVDSSTGSRMWRRIRRSLASSRYPSRKTLAVPSRLLPADSG
jgi:hypothetical protein